MRTECIGNEFGILEHRNVANTRENDLLDMVGEFIYQALHAGVSSQESVELRQNQRCRSRDAFEPGEWSVAQKRQLDRHVDGAVGNRSDDIGCVLCVDVGHVSAAVANDRALKEFASRSAIAEHPRSYGQWKLKGEPHAQAKLGVGVYFPTSTRIDRSERPRATAAFEFEPHLAAKRIA